METERTRGYGTDVSAGRSDDDRRKVEEETVLEERENDKGLSPGNGCLWTTA